MNNLNVLRTWIINLSPRRQVAKKYIFIDRINRYMNLNRLTILLDYKVMNLGALASLREKRLKESIDFSKVRHLHEKINQKGGR